MSATIGVHSIMELKVNLHYWDGYYWIDLQLKQESFSTGQEREQEIVLWFKDRDLARDFAERMEGFGQLPAKPPAEYTGSNSSDELITSEEGAEA